MWKLLRESGATARTMLATAAAQTLGVPVASLTTEKAKSRAVSGRRLKFGALRDQPAALPISSRT